MTVATEQHIYAISAHDLGRVLKERRLKAGFTQSAVATNLGSSKAYICETEQGRTSLNIRTLVKLANAYHIAPSELLFLAEEEVPS